MVIQQALGPMVARQETEVVECKGIGHPDTICDGVMESVSLALCRAYTERFGAVLHHNCDKGLLVAGRVEHRFGGGRVVEPMRLVIGDRATARRGDESVDVAGLAIDAAGQWIGQHLRHVDRQSHVAYQIELKPGSEALTDLFDHDPKLVPGANDTSAAVGYAPLSETEAIVLETERYLNGPTFKQRFPQTGEDVKVMGVRCGRRLNLTVAMPLVDRYVDSEATYFDTLDATRQGLMDHVNQAIRDLDTITVNLNLLDRQGAGTSGIYLTVTGTSAEHADSGQVGRGNRVNGLITPCRPQTMEAAAGKNPVNHVGKIYNVLANQLADQLYRQIDPVREATVWLVSRIGEPIDQPQVVSVQVHLDPGSELQDVRGPMERIVNQQLGRMPQFCRELAQGKYPVA